jgi:hypothetical protein
VDEEANEKKEEAKRAKEEARVATKRRMEPSRQVHEEGRVAKDAVATAAIMEGLGATSYKPGCTGGSNRPDADMDAIGRAAKQQEVVQATSGHQKKRAVAKILGIEFRNRSYKQGRSKQQWAKFLKPTAK